jgi:hypothetical protein
MTTGKLSELDLDALRRAIAWGRGFQQRNPQLRIFPDVLPMEGSAPWLELARYLASHAQTHHLGLRPWEVPPIDVDDGWCKPEEIARNYRGAYSLAPRSGADRPGRRVSRIRCRDISGVILTRSTNNPPKWHRGGPHSWCPYAKTGAGKEVEGPPGGLSTASVVPGTPSTAIFSGLPVPRGRAHLLAHGHQIS